MTDPSKIFDGLLILQYRTGTKNAMGVLVTKYHNKLCRHSYWYTHDVDASKDIVQDCWNIIINKLDSLKDPNLFGSWAYRIVTRKSLDFVRKKKSESAKLQEYYQVSTSYQNEEDNETAIKKLLTIIQTLPINQQVVIRLFYNENYSLKEISDILEISVGTVKSRLFHARERLKLILKKQHQIPLK